jgi:hypothetical protein
MTPPDDLMMKNISNTTNHIAPDIDNVPTKDSKLTDQRIGETNEHLSEISKNSLYILLNRFIIIF